MRVFTHCTGLFLLLLTPLTLISQSGDRHVTSDGARALYQRSAYAHGYIHGYEDGFHNGDLDIHMGRGERPLKVMKDYRDCSSYREQFGDKGFFKSGYKEGFREGYSDSIRGGQFRAIDQTGKIAAGVDRPSTPGFRSKDFDRAFADGYGSGLNQPASAPKDVDVQRVASSCQTDSTRGKAAHRGDYCDAYARGFTLGFEDAQASRGDHRTQTAKK